MVLVALVQIPRQLVHSAAGSCRASALAIAALAVSFSALVFATPGVLDPGFNGGSVITDFGSAYQSATGVAVDSAGRVVVAGELKVSGTSVYDAAIARYNGDGSPDPTFNGTGRLTHDIGGNDRVVGVAVDAQDRIVVAGYSNWHAQCGQQTSCGSNYNFFAARFNVDGTPDTTFGTGGKAIVGLGSDQDTATAVAIDSAGRIVVVGWTKRRESFFSDFMFHNEIAAVAMIRLTGNGALDTSFGEDGIVASNVSAGSSFDIYNAATAVAFDGSGRLILGVDYGGWGLVLRYFVNGLPDTQFLPVYLGDGIGADDCLESVINAVAVDPLGRILGAGYCKSGPRVVVVRAKSDGSHDLAFGTNSLAVLDFTPGAAQQARAITADALGRVTIAGFASSCGEDFLLARLDANGALDPLFGGLGTGFMLHTFAVSPCSVDRVNAMTLDRSRRFVVAGSTTVGSSTRFAVARFQTENPDFSFSPVDPINLTPGGTGTTTITINSIDGFTETLKIDPYGGVPGGFSWTFLTTANERLGSPLTIAPPANGSVSTLFRVTVSDIVVPGTYVVSLFDQRFEGNVAQVVVNVSATPPATGELIARFLDDGYIDSVNVARTMTQMLDAAQDSLARGNVAAAIHQLRALEQFITAQAGRHIATSATENGVSFDPSAVLISNVDALARQLGGV